MMAQYPDVFIMTFSIRIPNFVLLSQTAQLLLIFAMPPHYSSSTAVSLSAGNSSSFLASFILFILDCARSILCRLS